jgi:hypothetical protein
MWCSIHDLLAGGMREEEEAYSIVDSMCNFWSENERWEQKLNCKFQQISVVAKNAAKIFSCIEIYSEQSRC